MFILNYSLQLIQTNISLGTYYPYLTNPVCFRHSAVDVEINSKDVERTLTIPFSNYKSTTVSDVIRKQTDLGQTVPEIARKQILSKDSQLHSDVNRMIAESTINTHKEKRTGNNVSIKFVNRPPKLD